MPADSLIVKAHAKVNLTLRVLGKRSDGFHELDTIFERVSLHDTITFRAAPDIRLECTDRSLEGESNLVWRAADLLRRRHGVGRGAAMRLVKRIPVAGGMGGGSSDGAAALVGLNRFWRLGLSRKKLLSYALELGSDVPFFILGARFAHGRGRGEVLRVLRAPRRQWHVLAFPALQVSTKAIFMAVRPSDYASGTVSPAAVLRGLTGRKGTSARLENSLERPLFDLYPELGRLKRAFVEEGASAALASGSGPTIFGVVRGEAQGKALARRMKKRFPSVRFCVVSTA